MTRCADILLLPLCCLKKIVIVLIATSIHFLFTKFENHLEVVHLRISPSLAKTADLLTTYSQPYANWFPKLLRSLASVRRIHEYSPTSMRPDRKK